MNQTLNAVQDFEKWGYRRPRSWMVKYGNLCASWLLEDERQFWAEYRECREKALNAFKPAFNPDNDTYLPSATIKLQGV